MRQKLSGIRAALTRKFGPLPVWAWALMLGAALYVYRTRRSGASTAATADTGTATAPDASSPAAPVTLAPGESVYDPNTGQLLGGGQSQTPDNPGPGNPLIPLSPGESAYDPNTGQVITAPNGAPSTTRKTAAARSPAKSRLAQAKARVALGRGGSRTRTILERAGYSRAQIEHAIKTHSNLGSPKRRLKRKTQHLPTRKRASTRARSATVLKNAVHSVTSVGGHTARPRGGARSTRPPARQPAPVQRNAVMRQRPAAPRVVDHAAQRVVEHPVRAAAKAPPPRRRRRR